VYRRFVAAHLEWLGSRLLRSGQYGATVGTVETVATVPVSRTYCLVYSLTSRVYADMSETIFVTGAAGTTGSELVRLLSDHGVDVRAGVHTPSDAPDFGEGVEVIAIDFDDRESLAAAFDGCSKLYLVTPFIPDPERLVESAVSAAAESGVEHIVRLSAIGADSDAILATRWHGAGESIVRDSGLAYTFIRPTFFMQNLLGQADAIAGGAFYNMVGADVPASHLDARDVARVAAAVLTEEGHEGRTYELTGPAALTFDDAAETLTAVLGHDVSYVRVSEADLRASLGEQGMPEQLVDAYVELMQWIDTGGAATVTSDVEDVTGASAGRFETFVRDHADALGTSDRRSPTPA
jgi:uncharacterized protein YbjT (DUF2867 family)